jgi:hypothetical protein
VDLNNPDELESERLLQTARPEPSERFVRCLESELFPAPARWRLRPRRGMLAMAAAAAGVACALALISLTGTGPLSGDDEVRATDDCRYVERVRTLPRADIVEVDGELRVRTVPERRVVRIKRCG